MVTTSSPDPLSSHTQPVQMIERHVTRLLPNSRFCSPSLPLNTTTTENDAAGWYQQFIFRIWYLTFYALHFPLASASPWFRPPAVLFLYVLGTFYAATKRGLINLHKWCNLFYHSLSWFIRTARASIHNVTKINAFYTLFTKSHPPLALPPSLSVLIRNPVKLIWSNFLLVLWSIEFCFNKFSSPELEWHKCWWYSRVCVLGDINPSRHSSRFRATG